MTCNDIHTHCHSCWCNDMQGYVCIHIHCHSCWCKPFEWIRIEWIRTGGIRVERIRIGGMCIGGIRFEWICVQNRCKPFEWIRIEWIRTGGIRVEGKGILVGYVLVGYVLNGYVCQTDANLLNGYALNGYVLVGYVLKEKVYWWDTYWWDTFWMDMCGVMDMCGICLVWDTPTIFWRTLRRNVFREKGFLSRLSYDFAKLGTWWSKEHGMHETWTKNTFVHFVEPNVPSDFQGFSDWLWRWMPFVKRFQIWNRRFAEDENTTAHDGIRFCDFKLVKELFRKEMSWILRFWWQDTRAVLHATGLPDKLALGIFVTNHLCPSRLLLSSLPCHHHHHHRNHHHFLVYTRPQQFSTLVLGSPQSPSWQFVMVHAIFLGQSFWVS